MVWLKTQYFASTLPKTTNSRSSGICLPYLLLHSANSSTSCSTRSRWAIREASCNYYLSWYTSIFWFEIQPRCSLLHASYKMLKFCNNMISSSNVEPKKNNIELGTFQLLFLRAQLSPHPASSLFHPHLLSALLSLIQRRRLIVSERIVIHQLRLLNSLSQTFSKIS